MSVTMPEPTIFTNISSETTPEITFDHMEVPQEEADVMPISLVKATVLYVKHYPTEDIVVLIHGSPTVITLRGVKVCSHASVDQSVKAVQSTCIEKVGNALDIHDICESDELIVVDVGVWNVHTAAMHGGRVEICGGGKKRDVVSTTPDAVVLPTRRKRVSMQ